MQRCLERDEQAARTLQRDFLEPVLGVLVTRGAPIGEAEDTVNQLWAESIVRPDGRPGRLSHYNGECLLTTFLNTIAFNMWLTERRKQARRSAIEASPDGPGRESGAAGTATEESPADRLDAPLIELLSEAINAGSRCCSPEGFVVLQLIRFDGLRGFEVARMFNRDPSWATRTREAAQEQWRAGTEAFLREREPLLNLRWEDVIAMCSVATPASLGVA